MPIALISYPWLHQQAIQEGFNNLTGTTNPTTCQHMSLTRSTFAGGQRFCSYLWSGDTDSRFDVLAQQVTAGVSMAASGISSWTLDIGGFSGLNVSTSEVRGSVIHLQLKFTCVSLTALAGPRAVCQMVFFWCFSSLRTLPSSRDSGRKVIYFIF